VGGWEKFHKQKERETGGRGENKVPKRKQRSGGIKKLRSGLIRASKKRQPGMAQG
jgi:hypothetical protein